MATLFDHFQLLLEDIANHTDRRAGDLALLSEAERRELLAERSRIDPRSAAWAKVRERLGSALPGGLREIPGVAPQLVLLDHKLRAVPLGGQGEIYLGGIDPAAAAGDAAAVAATWRPHPFSEEPGRRLAATGLEGRRSADGRPELVAPSAPREPAEAAAAEREETAVDRTATELAAAEALRSELTSREKRLSDARRALLARRLRGRAKQAPQVETIPRRPAGAPARLSYVQEQLWFLDQLNPGRSAYNMPFPLLLEGPLDPAALAASFAEIRRRHEVLRATVRMLDLEPVMEFAPPTARAVPLVDLTALAQPERDEELSRLIDADAARPFDLARGSLVRLTLLRRGDEDHVLLFNVHHIVFDGWSMGIFVRELTTLYRPSHAARSVPDSGPEELPIQYADFAHWQRRRLQEEGLKRQLEYWRRQLAGVPSLIELPWDRPRPTRPRLRGRGLPIAFPEALSEPLNALGQQHDATLFMIMLAAFKTLLYRHSGQRDLVVGTPIAGRTRKELEGLIGFFVNTLVLRTHLPAHREPSFVELLERVRQVAMDAYAHQDLPFDQVVKELAPERSGGANPLFQVMFVLQTAPGGSAEMPGLKLRHLGMSWGTAKFDLTIVLGGTGMSGMLEYDTDLFDATTMDRLIAHFTRLLAGIVADPQRRLGELSLLSAAEGQQLLVEWNDTGAPRLCEEPIHALFERWAERTPDAVALVGAETQMSYGELDRQANQLARLLRSRGVKAEVPVGILIERSPEMVVGILGILKAGGAYLPIDPASPPERREFMLRDAGVPVLLTRTPPEPSPLDPLSQADPPPSRERGRMRGKY